MLKGVGIFLMVVTTILGAILASPPTLAGCGRNHAEAKNVKVTIVVILGCCDKGKTDERLKCIADLIKGRCKKMKCFRWGSMTSKSLPVNTKTTFDLLEGQEVTVIINHAANKRNKVSLTVHPPRTGTITYRTVCGKFFPIVTPYETKKGERLILAIRVQPCLGN